MKRRNWLKLIAVMAIVCTATVFAEEAATPAATPAAAPVKGNPESKIYHKSSCRFYTAKGTTKEFKTEAEAVKAGYKPCKQCAAPKKEKTDKEETESSGSGA